MASKQQMMTLHLRPESVVAAVEAIARGAPKVCDGTASVALQEAYDEMLQESLAWQAAMINEALAKNRTITGRKVG